MPRLKIETYGAGDQTWLASLHALANARTGNLDISTFTKATHYPNGYLPSGLELSVADEGALVPWTGAAGEKLGFLVEDTPTDGTENPNVAYLWHGAIKTANLPIAHVAATTGDASGFTFVQEA